MYQIRQTDTFKRWLAALRDTRGKARIISRLDSARLGNLGDAKNLGAGLYEMRIHVGPGYRVYYRKHPEVVIVLLCGGDKSSQARDVETGEEDRSGIGIGLNLCFE